MSKQQTPAPSTALAPRGTAAVARQEEEAALAALKEAGIDVADQTGKDKIDGKNLILPFLAIAQKTSPQIEEGKSEYHPDLKFLDIFESLDGNVTEIYGREPVKFIPLICREHAMEFEPWTSGGGLIDRNVPLEDKRCKWNDDATDPKDRKPKATIFVDWVVLIVPKNELAILSFKSTSLKMGYILKKFTKNPRVPLYAQQYTVRVEKDSDGGNSWGLFVVQPAGVADPATARYAKKALEEAAEKDIAFDHKAERDVVDGEVMPATGAPTTGKGPDDIPF